MQPETQRVGVVLGSRDATPLDFWVGVADGQLLELDELVVVTAEQADGQTVSWYGMVDQVVKRFEGSQFDTDAFRAAAGTLPVDVAFVAHIQVTRIDPEVFVPPEPGTEVGVTRGEAFQRALYFDRMEKKLPIGLTRKGEPVFANLEFMDGQRGAHVSISGVSGVATKTSYATFMLYSLFHSGSLGMKATNAKAVIFNVKGEDLLWLDKANTRLSDDDRAQYAKLGLPVGPFQSVGLYAPARKHVANIVPDTQKRLKGVTPYVWTLKEFARERLLRFSFAGADDSRKQLSTVVDRVEAYLYKLAKDGDKDAPWLEVADGRLDTFEQLVDHLDEHIDEIVRKGRTAGGTQDAFLRRLHGAKERMGYLIRGDSEAVGKQIDWEANQVTVIDMHTLRNTAQMFVVGVLLKRIMEDKERKGPGQLVFVVLDELNKYAPRTGWSPIQDTILDIAERGRSLGVSLFGAQQTASEVERRVVANAAIRVVGRLDSAEAERGEYGFLTRVARTRATFLKQGSMIVSQPEIPTPLLIHFPFPAWATRDTEAAEVNDAPLLSRIRDD